MGDVYCACGLGGGGFGLLIFLRYVESTKDFVITLAPLAVCVRPSILTSYLYMTICSLRETQRENMSLCKHEASVLDWFVKCKLKETYSILFNVDLALYLEAF